MAEAGARRPFFRRRKTCPFTGPNAPKIAPRPEAATMPPIVAAIGPHPKAATISGSGAR